MAELTINLARRSAAVWPGIAEFCAASLRAARKELVRRRAVRDLQSLEDWMLKDIGLHRSEIEAAAAGGEPTVFSRPE